MPLSSSGKGARYDGYSHLRKRSSTGWPSICMTGDPPQGSGGPSHCASRHDQTPVFLVLMNHESLPTIGNQPLSASARLDEVTAPAAPAARLRHAGGSCRLGVAQCVGFQSYWVWKLYQDSLLIGDEGDA